MPCHYLSIVDWWPLLQHREGDSSAYGASVHVYDQLDYTHTMPVGNLCVHADIQPHACVAPSVCYTAALCAGAGS